MATCFKKLRMSTHRGFWFCNSLYWRRFLRFLLLSTTCMVGIYIFVCTIIINIYPCLFDFRHTPYMVFNLVQLSIIFRDTYQLQHCSVPCLYFNKDVKTLLNSYWKTHFIGRPVASKGDTDFFNGTCLWICMAKTVAY